MKYFFLFISLSFIYSCSKTEEQIKLPDLTNESNYKIVSKRENDTIYKISGENKHYKLLSGYKDIKNNVKVGWWKIKDKKNNHLYEIEYISLDKNKENQIKLYDNNRLIKRFSQYYEVKYINKGYEFKIYFPQNDYEHVNVEFGYITSDGSSLPLRKTITCNNENDHYKCFIPVQNEHQLIAGIVTEFASRKKANDKVLLSAKTMYVNTPQ